MEKSKVREAIGTIHGRLSVLADPLRCRLLRLLESHELTVSEICAVLQLPQSTASRHLKTLADGGWIGARREGTSRLYAASPEGWTGATRRLWALVREEGNGVESEQDRRRLEAVLARRSSRSQEFFSGAAGDWARLRREMFGRRFDLEGLLALADPYQVIGDLGCGSGQTTATLAPYVGRVVAVDDSEAMLAAARARLERFENVELRKGRLEALPIADAELDNAILFLVLHHLPDPRSALAEAARVLRPGGRLVVVDMLPHGHEEYRRAMGHLWLGFGRQEMISWLEEAGLQDSRLHPLDPDPAASGPGLFVATAGKAALVRSLPDTEASAA